MKFKLIEKFKQSIMVLITYMKLENICLACETLNCSSANITETIIKNNDLM